MNDDKQTLILIVDDSPLNLQLLRYFLERNGYKLELAPNGDQAMEFVRNQQPDLILLDIMMPGMDGIEVCRQLKEKEETKNIPIIFITALTGHQDKLRAFKAGGVDYITKPFMPEEVLARIKVHIELKKAIERLRKMSVTDEMTGVFNRRWAYEILAKQMFMAKREHSNLVVCYIDIDNLKIINDTFGHAHGDILINTVVDALKSATRASDYICRMGGDEFLLIFPKAKLVDSDSLIKRIRENLHHQKINGLPIDFSFGFFEFHYEDSLSPDELIKMADSNMYRQKNRKKNRDAFEQ